MGAQEVCIGWFLDDNSQHVRRHLVRHGEEFVGIFAKKRGHFAENRFTGKGALTTLHLGNKAWAHPYRLGKPAQPSPALLAPVAHVLPEGHTKKS